MHTYLGFTRRLRGQEGRQDERRHSITNGRGPVDGRPGLPAQHTITKSVSHAGRFARLTDVPRAWSLTVLPTKLDRLRDDREATACPSFGSQAGRRSMGDRPLRSRSPPPFRKARHIRNQNKTRPALGMGNGVLRDLGASGRCSWC